MPDISKCHWHLLLLVLNFNHFLVCVLVSHCGSIHISMITKDYEHLCMDLLVISFSVQFVLKSFFQILIGLFVFIFTLQEFFIYSGYKSFVRYRYFVTFFSQSMAYLFSYWCFLRGRVLSFDEVYFISFWFNGCCFCFFA